MILDAVKNNSMLLLHNWITPRQHAPDNQHKPSEVCFKLL